MSRRSLLSTSSDRSLYIYTGVDTMMTLKLGGDTLVCTNGGGAGTHEGLLGWGSPSLHFGYPACYINRDPQISDEEIINIVKDGGSPRNDLFSEVWNLGTALNLGFTSSKIDSIKLLGSGRDYVAVGDDSDSHGCYINWTDDAIVINDPDGSSTMYCFKINFR